MLKRIASASLAAMLALTCGDAEATAQVSDVILVGGRDYPLNTNPLGRHLARLGDKAPKFDSPHTANWRGYVATWELAGGKLHLRKVDGYRLNPAPDDNEDTQDEILEVDGMSELFPAGGDVVASWYTGALIIPDGELVNYVHMGYGSTYARYIVAIVRDGVEAERHALSREEFENFRDDKFAKYKATDEYKKQFEGIKAKADGMTDAQIEAFIKEFEAEGFLSAL